METIKLEYPIIADGEKINELKLRRPKVKDLITIDESGASNSQSETILFSNLCEVTPEAIKELDVKDYAQLQKAYTGFLS